MIKLAVLKMHLLSISILFSYVRKHVATVDRQVKQRYLLAEIQWQHECAMLRYVHTYVVHRHIQ